jgi:hypothetical protein
MRRGLKSSFWVVTALGAFSQLAWGAGYEKTIMWSGKEAGVAGAGVSTVHDSEALYFNPAGLADVDHLDVSVNFSPTLDQSRGPSLAGTGSILTGNTEFLPIFGFTAAYKPIPKLGIGIGAYVSGGARAEIDNIDFSSLGFQTLKPNESSDVSVIEYSIGAGYEVLPGFKVGASWRITHVTGSFSTPVVTYAGSTPAALAALTVNGLSGSSYNGFRFGAQYDADSWGVGAMVRTGITFTLDGSVSGSLQSAAAPSTIAPISAAPATASNSLPVEGTVGGYVDLADKTFRVIGEYSYINYQEDQNLVLGGTFQIPGGGSSNLSNIPENWHDLHVGRIGFEYRGFQDSVLRAGYALTGQVTSNAYARTTFSSPGLGHSVTLGYGRTFLDKKLDIDVAVEGSTASGNVSAADISTATGVAPVPGLTTQPGNFSTWAAAAHLGATYRF